MNLKKFFDAIGLNGTKWQWRLYQWERRIRLLFSKEGREGKRLTMKRCRRCSTLNPLEEKRCYQCGRLLLPYWLNWLPLSLSGPGVGPTMILLTLNFLWFALTVALSGAQGLMHPTGEALIRSGAQFWPLVFQGEFYRVISYAFVHIGLIHFLFNMVVLHQIGPFVREETGRLFIVLYVSTAVTATIAGLVMHPLVITAGASGSLFGLIGFLAVHAHRRGAIPLRNAMIQWALYAFIFGIIVGADNAAHFGGAMGGIAFGALLPRNFRPGDHSGGAYAFAAGIGWIITLVSLGFVLLKLL